jgi:hypothetical protein
VYAGLRDGTYVIGVCTRTANFEVRRQISESWVNHARDLRLTGCLTSACSWRALQI